MSNVKIPVEVASMLQANLLRFLTVGTGNNLPNEVVKSAMLIRANSLAKGVSGINIFIIERFLEFLNNNITPCVPSLGSIGASGDLIPLTYISGSILGISPEYEVDVKGQIMSCRDGLAQLGLPHINTLGPKEGLAMINGTSVMTGFAALCTYDFITNLKLCIGINSLYYQALLGSTESLQPFIHECKPHHGQSVIANEFLNLLVGTKMKSTAVHGEGELVQDRYSIRCIAQYYGPIYDEILWSYHAYSRNRNELGQPQTIL